MNMRIDNATQQSPTGGRDNTAQQEQPDAGAWRGASVSTMADPNDILLDAAEEISFAHSEHVETHKLEEREIEEPPPLEMPRVESIIAYLEAAARGNPEERLKEFVDALRRHERQGDGTNARQEARQQFESVTEQFLALSYATEALAREGGHDALLEEVRTALEDLNAESGPRIRADVNTIEAAAAFGRGDAARTEAFQATYRDAVLDGEDLASMLKGALERFGADDYRGAVQHWCVRSATTSPRCAAPPLSRRDSTPCCTTCISWKCWRQHSRVASYWSASSPSLRR